MAKFMFVVAPLHLHNDPALPYRGVEMAIALRQLFIKAMQSEGGEIKQGAAPKCQLERVTAKALKQIQRQQHK